MGSMPRFAPGSLANRQFSMDVDPEVIEIDVAGKADPTGLVATPGSSTPRSAGNKRKSNSEPDVQSKLRPRP
jgi:hypothetical protein